jgi:hypothetical protein
MSKLEQEKEGQGQRWWVMRKTAIHELIETRFLAEFSIMDNCRWQIKRRKISVFVKISLIV